MRISTGTSFNVWVSDGLPGKKVKSVFAVSFDSTDTNTYSNTAKNNDRARTNHLILNQLSIIFHPSIFSPFFRRLSNSVIDFLQVLLSGYLHLTLYVIHHSSQMKSLLFLLTLKLSMNR